MSQELYFGRSCYRRKMNQEGKYYIVLFYEATSWYDVIDLVAPNYLISPVVLTVHYISDVEDTPAMIFEHWDEFNSIPGYFLYNNQSNSKENVVYEIKAVKEKIFVATTRVCFYFNEPCLCNMTYDRTTEKTSASPTSQPTVEDDVSTATSQPTVEDDVSTATSQPTVEDDVSTATSQPTVEDDVSTATLQPTIEDDVSTATSQPTEEEVVSTAISQPTVEDDVSTATSQPTVEDDVSTATSQPTVEDDVSTATSQPTVEDDVSTATSQPTVEDDVSTATSQPTVEDDVSTATSQPTVEDDVSTATSQPTEEEVVSTATSQPTIEDDVSTATSQLTVEDDVSTATSQPTVEDEVSTATSQPTVEDDVSTATSQPTVEDDVSTATSQPTVEDDVSTARSQPSVEDDVSTATSQPTVEDDVSSATSQPTVEDDVSTARSQPSVEDDVSTARSQPTEVVVSTATSQGTAECFTTTGVPEDNVGSSFSSAMDLARRLANTSVGPMEASRMIRSIAQNLNSSLHSKFSRRPADVLHLFDVLAHKLKEPGMKIESDVLEIFGMVVDSLASSTNDDVDSHENDIAKIMLSLEDIVKASLYSLKERKSECIFSKLFIGRYTGTVRFPDGDLVHKDSWLPGSENQIYVTMETKEEQEKFAVIIHRLSNNFVIPRMARAGDIRLSNEGESLTVGSNVVSISSLGAVQDVTVNLIFSVQQSELNTPQCAFIDTRLSKGTNVYWSDVGCRIVSQNFTHVVCTCQHMTNFAVLMSRFDNRDDNLELTWMTKVGIYISFSCCALASAIFILTWKSIRSDKNLLHLHLCGCLMVGYILFMYGSDKTEDKGTCSIIAMFLQYIFLAVFCLMLGEGIQILRTVVYVFQTQSIVNDILTMAYGAPLTIVMVSLYATFFHGYGDDKHCWLTSERGVIWAFLVPVIVILIINGIILVYIIITMLRTRAMRDRSHYQRATSAFRAILVLSCLLGSSWFVGILTLIDKSIYTQYVFIAVTSSQGFLILFFHCLGQKEVRQALWNLCRRRTF
ncbi:uncharacterized protein LOC131931091 [Physella acuta]|uniref:uncharacterized protein LOC131931091 n=1 Tax=Physella acuta TaxID=109671 RepID=UPI0027DDAE67|nr:uncharacterized protein LOC131931091 [Physella acuta]